MQLEQSFVIQYLQIYYGTSIHKNNKNMYNKTKINKKLTMAIPTLGHIFITL